MEIRVLRYFLTVVQEGSITQAAKALHVTQPTLSRQLMELEGELGQQLFIRGSRRISLTEEGLLLRQRAEEILSLIDKTTTEFPLWTTPQSAAKCASAAAKASPFALSPAH